MPSSDSCAPATPGVGAGWSARCAPAGGSAGTAAGCGPRCGVPPASLRSLGCRPSLRDGLPSTDVVLGSAVERSEGLVAGLRAGPWADAPAGAPAPKGREPGSSSDVGLRGSGRCHTVELSSWDEAGCQPVGVLPGRQAPRSSCGAAGSRAVLPGPGTAPAPGPPPRGVQLGHGAPPPPSSAALGTRRGAAVMPTGSTSSKVRQPEQVRSAPQAPALGTTTNSWSSGKGQTGQIGWAARLYPQVSGRKKLLCRRWRNFRKLRRFGGGVRRQLRPKRWTHSSENWIASGRSSLGGTASMTSCARRSVGHARAGRRGPTSARCSA